MKALLRELGGATAHHQYLNYAAPGYTPHLIAFLTGQMRQRGIALEEALAGSEISPAMLESYPGRYSALQILRVAANSLRLAPGIAFEVGRQLRLIACGIYGYAILSSPSRAHMIDVISKYAHLIDPLTKVRHRQLSGYSVWDLRPLLPGDPEHPFYQFAIELKLASSCAVAQDLYGTQLRPHKVRLRYGAPPQAARYAAHLGCPIDFGQEVNQIIFSTAGQAPPLLCNPDPITHAMALECCEREARQLLPAASYTNMLATLLRNRPAAAHNIEQAAACLALHPRTLRRRLKNEGTSFSNIVYEHRLTMACDYLSRDQLNIEEIAARLGYSDAANFSKAFSTWTGLPPGRYRSAHQAANRSASKSD